MLRLRVFLTEYDNEISIGTGWDLISLLMSLSAASIIL